jgi:hypothetical protein
MGARGANATSAGPGAATTKRTIERYLLGERHYLLRARLGDVNPATHFELVVQISQRRGEQPAERMLAEIRAADADGAREAFWRHLVTDLLDDPERVAYAEIGLGRVGMVRDVSATRWHVGAVGVRAGAEMVPYTDPAEAMRAWLALVQTLTPR